MNPKSKKPNITLSDHNRRTILMAASYDTWKTTGPDDAIHKPSKEFLLIEIAEIEKEIAWNERRLENIILDDVNRQLTQDLVADLRQERESLLAVLNG